MHKVPVSTKLREFCADMRTKPYPIADVIPTLQLAADEIDSLETRLKACEDVLLNLTSGMFLGSIRGYLNQK